MSNKLVYIDKFGYAVTGEKPPGGIPIGLYMKDDEEETMSEDGKTYVEGLLEDIKFLLMLQLITSGITGKQIAEILDFKKKDFVRLFPWADWEGKGEGTMKKYSYPCPNVPEIRDYFRREREWDEWTWRQIVIATFSKCPWFKMKQG